MQQEHDQDSETPNGKAFYALSPTLTPTTVYTVEAGSVPFSTYFVGAICWHIRTEGGRLRRKLVEQPCAFYLGRGKVPFVLVKPTI